MRIRSLALIGLLLHFAAPTVVVAQAVPSDSAPPPAFSRVEVRRFLVVVTVAGIAYTADDIARRAVQRPNVQESAFADGLRDFGDKWGQPGAISLAYAMWGGGYLARRPTIAASGLRAIETLTISGAVTQVVKWTAGRARPFATTNGRNDWQFTRGAREGGRYEAFPSGHATAAFAFATAVTEEVSIRAPQHAHWVGVASYGAATITAYARMHGEKHWLSDVTAGAGVGIVTGLAISRWHATRPDNLIDRWLLRPTVSQSPTGETRIGLRLTPPLGGAR